MASKKNQNQSTNSECLNFQEFSEVAVIGDGWAALGAVGFLAASGIQVIWIPGTGSNLLAPLPSLPAGVGAQTWQSLFRRLGIEGSSASGISRMDGSYIREYRNKAFRNHDGDVWGPEVQFFSSSDETRFERSLGELEMEARARLLVHPQVRRIEGLPLKGLQSGEMSASRRPEVIFASGEKIAADQVIYADRWVELVQLEGLPKNLGLNRGRGYCGVLQALFNHNQAIGAGTLEGFSSVLNKEAGEEIQRSVWGYFMPDQQGTAAKSIWTVFLTAEEVEDNHQIAKKLRKMKQALDKMFSNHEWISEGTTEFMQTVVAEHVRFEESLVSSEGLPVRESIHVPELGGIRFLTDSYGPACALEQVSHLLGSKWIDCDRTASDSEVRAEPQGESVNFAGSADL